MTYQLDLLRESFLYGYGFANNPIQLPNTVVNPQVQCDPAILRCTLSAVPNSPDLLAKCRLPFGFTLQVMRDTSYEMPLLDTKVVRCTGCRAYLNPYVYMPDSRRWKCNVCYGYNELPDDVCWNQQTRCFDPLARPEFHFANAEYRFNTSANVPSPAPPVFVFILDVGSDALDIGYLHAFSEQLLASLDSLPAQDALMIGFIGVDSAMHFYQFELEGAPPKQLIVNDLVDPFWPTYKGLVVPLKKFRKSIRSFVQSIPRLYESSNETGNCVGTAIAVTKRMIVGSLTPFTSRPLHVIDCIRRGALSIQEMKVERPAPPAASKMDDSSAAKQAVDTVRRIIGKPVSERNVMPSTDYYKRVAIEDRGRPVAVDLFLLGARHMDIASMAEICKHSSGALLHFPNYHFVREQREVRRFERLFTRYLRRKLALDAMLRIRVSEGISVQSYHGNFLVRTSSGLLSMASVSPDTSIGAQLALDEKLPDGLTTVIIQAAVLYVSGEGDRRVRVHTLCLPVVSEAVHVFNNFDIKATVSLLGKMAADRGMSGTECSDIRASISSAVGNALEAYNSSLSGDKRPQLLLAPAYGHLKFFPLFTLGMLRNRAFAGASEHRLPSIDRRVVSMMVYRNAPVEVILLETCPLLYPVDDIDKADPPRLPLSYQYTHREGVYLMDTGTYVYLYVRCEAQPAVLHGFFGVSAFPQIDEDGILEEIDTPLSHRLHRFLDHLEALRGCYAPVIIIREDGRRRELFTVRLIEDRSGTDPSYVEFLELIRKAINST